MISEKNFFDVYKKRIAPKIRRIDVLLRSRREFTVSETANLLAISPDEVFTVLGDADSRKIDPKLFLAIMRRGSSELCEMLRREIECGSPHIYNPAQIAYIYNLSEPLVKNACAHLSITEITQTSLPKIFELVPVVR